MSNGKFPYIYRGIVRGVVKDGRQRLTLEVPGVYGAGETSPPAKASASGGFSPNFGGCWTPPVGSSVWVFFEAGSSQHPVWFGGWVGSRSDGSDLPAAFLGHDDTGDFPDRGAGTYTDAWDNDFVEPGPKSHGEYPNIRGWRSESGHILIMDDDAGKELVRLAHKDGSQIEWGPGGAEVHITKGSRHHRVDGNEFLQRSGNVDQIVDGDMNLTVRGSYKRKVFGSVTDERTGSVEDVLDGNLTKTFAGIYNKTIGNEVRTVQGHLQSLVLGAKQTGVGRYLEQTIGTYASHYVGGGESADAWSVACGLGNIHNIAAVGNIMNEVLAGNILNSVATGSIQNTASTDISSTAGGNASMTAAGLASMTGATAQIIAPSIDLGAVAGSRPVARIGDFVTVTLGPITLPGAVVSGSTVVRASG